MTDLGKFVAVLFYSGEMIDEAELCKNFGIKPAELVKIKDKANDLLEKVGLADMAQHISDTLAYGDIKRLELAMALVNQPKLLLMDEPTAGMSPSERHALMGLVQFLAKERDVAVIFTEHSMDMVFSFATRILVMAQGRILVEGTPQEVQNNALAQSVYLGRGKTIEGETV